MNWFLMAASAAAFATFAIHTWIGGPAIARPLLRAGDIHDVAKYTNYYCWHLVTLTLFAMGGGFAWAAMHPEGIELGWMSFLLSFAFLVWNVLLIAWKKQKPLEMPQWILFLVVSALGAFGLFA